MSVTTASVIGGCWRIPADSDTPVHAVSAEPMPVSLWLRDEEAQVYADQACADQAWTSADRLVIRAVIRAGGLPPGGLSGMFSANPDVSRRRPASKRLSLFPARSMARLVRFQRICNAAELPDRNAESDDRDHQSGRADPVPHPHIHRLIGPDHREGKGNVYRVRRRYPHSLGCRTRSSCQRDALGVGHLTTSHQPDGRRSQMPTHRPSATTADNSVSAVAPKRYLRRQP